MKQIEIKPKTDRIKQIQKNLRQIVFLRFELAHFGERERTKIVLNICTAICSLRMVGSIDKIVETRLLIDKIIGRFLVPLILFSIVMLVEKRIVDGQMKIVAFQWKV